MASTTLFKDEGVGVLCAGGAINGATLTAKAYLWNFCTSSWSALDTFAVPRSNMKAASDGGMTAYVVGGFTTVGVGTADRFTLTAIEGNCNPPLDVDENGRGIPVAFGLLQNYPNPFNPSTTIQYGLPVQSVVLLKVYDILGQEVATVVNTEQSAGFFTVHWNGQTQSGSLVASGVYFYRIEATPVDGRPPFVSRKKMLFLK
jgi:hypothetical protein